MSVAGAVWQSGTAKVVGWERLESGVWEVRVMIDGPYPVGSEQRRAYEEAVMVKLLQGIGK